MTPDQNEGTLDDRLREGIKRLSKTPRGGKLSRTGLQFQATCDVINRLVGHGKSGSGNTPIWLIDDVRKAYGKDFIPLSSRVDVQNNAELKASGAGVEDGIEALLTRDADIVEARIAALKPGTQIEDWTALYNVLNAWSAMSHLYPVFHEERSEHTKKVSSMLKTVADAIKASKTPPGDVPSGNTPPTRVHSSSWLPSSVDSVLELTRKEYQIDDELIIHEVGALVIPGGTRLTFEGSGRIKCYGRLSIGGDSICWMGKGKNTRDVAAILIEGPGSKGSVIRNVIFMGLGSNHSEPSPYNNPIFALKGTEAQFVDCVFKQRYETGIESVDSALKLEKCLMGGWLNHWPGSIYHIGTAKPALVVQGGELELIRTTFYDHIGLSEACVRLTEVNINISGGTITNCDSMADGGGVFMDNVKGDIRNLTLNKNAARNGGAAFIKSSHITLRDCEVTENKATARGGGIYMVDSWVWLGSPTLVGNEAPEGSDIGYVGRAPMIDGGSISGAIEELMPNG